jgi:hypothetical protein
MRSALDRKMTDLKARWRDFLPVHPAADLFPLMSVPESVPELRELGEDINASDIGAAAEFLVHVASIAKAAA